MEEETQGSAEISGKDSDRVAEASKVGGIEDSGGSSLLESNRVGDGVDLENSPELRGVSSVTQVSEDLSGTHDEEDQFEQVSLKDQEKDRMESQRNEDSIRSSISDNLSQYSGNEEAFEFSSRKSAMDLDSALAGEMQHHHGLSPGSERGSSHALKPSSSSASFDSTSYLYGEGSPVGSPPKPRPRPVMPNVSPELLHLVDSAIMGKPESLDKLKGVVSGKESFGREEEIDGIAFLVVDSLLATMGGVESFDEGEDSNPPSVMLNSRAAIVSGELIPSLPCEC